jgi:hypothetical protein
MRHAGPTALDALEPLLVELRGFADLREKGRGVFYVKSRAFLHFHEDPAGLFADIRAPGRADFDRVKVDGEDGRLEIITRVRVAFGVE